MTFRDMFPTTNVANREKVERLYVHVQIYHHLHCEWWSWGITGTIFSLSATVVLALYIGLRHTELPWYLYWIFWLAGPGVLLQLFATGHDCVFATEDSDEVVEKLRSPAGCPALGKLSLEERKKILKRSKALRGLHFGIAGFTNFTWAVPLGAWDEILNQLLFLLSL